MHLLPLRLTRGEVLLVSGLGIVLGLIPYLVGLVFGFGAFVLTPIVVPIAAALFGFILGRAIKGARFFAGIVLAGVSGLTHVLLIAGTLTTLAVVNRDLRQLWAVAAVFPVAILVFTVAALFVSLGVYVGNANWVRFSEGA